MTNFQLSITQKQWNRILVRWTSLDLAVREDFVRMQDKKVFNCEAIWHPEEYPGYEDFLLLLIEKVGYLSASQKVMYKIKHEAPYHGARFRKWKELFPMVEDRTLRRWLDNDTTFSTKRSNEFKLFLELSNQ